MRHPKLICLIGDPVEHSISPIIHNELFKVLRLNYIYLAFKIDINELEYAVRGLKALGVVGFNVTIPHKVAIIKYLDKLSDEVQFIGAVNTVVNVENVLVGYNTDYLGVVNTFKSLNIRVDGCTATILGAGGACRAVVYALLSNGIGKIYILNRSLDRVKDLVNDFKVRLSNCELTPLRLGVKNLELVLKDSQILINTTPVGMYPKVHESLVPPELLRSDLIVMDVVYNPVMTKLLRDAEAKGAKVVDGVHMLVHQAATSFKLWVGVEPPINLMLRTAYNALGVSHE